MYIIVRSSLLKWVFSVSTDDGATFSAPRVLTTHPSKQSYIYGEWVTANRLRFFANENAALEATLRIFEWDVVTGNIYAASNTIVGNSETGGVNFDDMTIFRPYTADRSSQIICFGNDATSIMYGQLNDRDELSRQVVAKLNTGADPFVPANWATTAIRRNTPVPAISDASTGRARSATVPIWLCRVHRLRAHRHELGFAADRLHCGRSLDLHDYEFAVGA